MTVGRHCRTARRGNIPHYCGNFTFDGKQLITRVDAASDADRLGTDQVRDVSFEGPLMILRPPAKPYGSVVQQRVLYWEKVAEA